MEGDFRDQGSTPPPDQVLAAVADYVTGFSVRSEEALATARDCLMDSLGCALLALNYPACRRLLGPVVPGATLDQGARVPGTGFRLEPVHAAFNLGAMVRWLDYNDTWLAAEWGHPSDNLAAVLMVADYLGRSGGRKLTVGAVLADLIKAYEIQGVLALENGFNRVGLDHVLLVRIASTAVATHLLGGGRGEIVNALSNAWIDGGALRTYRQAPNTGTRKSWAAGDAASRAVRLALMSAAGEMGYSSALTAREWGFQEVLFQGRTLSLPRPFGTYVVENVLFKISFPAEFHAQTAAEAAVRLHPRVKERLDEIQTVAIETQESALRIINKTGPLKNPADRDHCLQYVTAVALIRGGLTAEDYEEEAARDPRIDVLRDKMQVSENRTFTRDYLDPEKRSIANAVQVFFRDGSSTERLEVEYPLGHRRRRTEGAPPLREKFARNLDTRLPAPRCRRILDLFEDADRLMETTTTDFVDLFTVEE